VAAEWDYDANKPLTPQDVVAGANKRVWWRCPEGPDHSWRTSANKRTYGGQGCPCCANQKLSVTNSLEARYPRAAALWHPTRNGDLHPTDVIGGTNKRLWWRCNVSEEHEWRATANSLTQAGTGCPLCTLTPRSAQEMRLAHELSAVIDFDLDQHKVRVDGRLRDVDIVIEPLRLIVEFDGAYWHRNKHAKDAEKTALLEAENWSVIRVRERPLDPVHPNDVMVETLAPPKEVADAVLKKIVSVTGSKFDKLDEYLASTGPWRDEEALAAIREYQAENAAKKAARDAKRQQRNTSKK